MQPGGRNSRGPCQGGRPVEGTRALRSFVFLASLGVLLLTRCGPVWAYDGPSPATYDKTIDTIRVVMTTPGKILEQGASRFTLVAYVPVVRDTVGQVVDVEIRKSSSAGTSVLARCTYVPQWADVGFTVAIPCTRFLEVPATAADGALSVYPFVLRRSSETATQKVHDGSPFKVPVSIVVDDTFEDNDSTSRATPLGLVNRTSFADLASRDADYYRFTVPSTLERAEIGIAFWHGAADLDLWVYDAAGQVMAISDGYDDHELVVFPAVPGADYLVRVVNFSDTPAFYDLTVATSTRSQVLITSGPTGSPNPAAPGSTVTLSAEALDGEASPVSFSWQVVCPALPSAGTLQNASAREPEWLAPDNPTGTQQTCTMSVTARNGAGQSDTSSSTQFVDPSLDRISVSAGPTGTPAPVPSQGQVALNVTAFDSLGHPLSYQWRVSCPWTFNPGLLSDAFAQQPTWRAPINRLGTEMPCTIEVTLSDAFHHSTSASFVQQVASEDTVTVVTGPTGTPNPVQSGGAVAMSAIAQDSQGHPVTYTWSASCATGGIGSFLPSPGVQAPTWTAPTNLTGSARPCSLTVRAADGFGNSDARTVTVLVNSIPDEITIGGVGTLGAPGPVDSGGSLPVTVTASDSLGHSLSSTWRATCSTLAGGGAFVPGPGALGATWQAPVNLTGAPKSCLIEVTVRDAFARSATASFEQVVAPAAHTLVFTEGPDGTPDVVASEALVVTSLGAVDSYSHPLTYEWTSICPTLPGPGTFLPDNLARAPTWKAPANLTAAWQTCTLHVTVRDSESLTLSGSYDVTVDLANDVVTVTSGPTAATSATLASGGATGLSVVAEDSYGHALTYAWQALCPGLPGAPGAFSPGSSPTPSWTAPENRTGLEQACTISVTVSDTFGHHATASVPVRVASVPDVITVESGPGGSTDPVQSGSAVPLTLSATDSLDHPLQFLWWASCPALGASGTFTPASNVRQPTWTAPANRTGSQQSCTLNVKVADGRGTSATRAFLQRVDSVPHTIDITQGLHASPATVASRGQVELTVQVTDSLNHRLERRWDAICPAPLGSGSFSPWPYYDAMMWSAPANLTGTDRTCAVTVTVTDSLGESVSGTTNVVVRAAVDAVKITSATSNRASVGSNGWVNLAVVAEDPFDHPLNYAWAANCGAAGEGQFLPDTTTAAPTWQAPTNTSASPLSCSIRILVSDGLGQSDTAWLALSVQPVNVITVTIGPGVPTEAVEPGSTVGLSALTSNTLGLALTYAWTSTCPGLPSGGLFDNPSSATPTWTAPLNTTGAASTCTITVTVTDPNGETSSRSFDVRVAPPNSVTITSPATSAQNPLASGTSTRLQVGATDTRNRPLSYLWTATCQGLASTGSFDNPASASPLWTAPTNRTGVDLTCTLQVKVTNDEGQSRTSTLVLGVTTVPQSLRFDSGPSSAPNPVVSGGSVQLSVTASDAWNRPLGFAWTSACPTLGTPGSFDSPSRATPRWTAPTNQAGTPQVCTLTVAVTDDRGNTASRQLSVTVGPVLQITGTPTGPGGNPNAVSPGGGVDLSTGGGTLPGQALTYLWTAVCPGLGGHGSFTSPGTPTSTWVPPVNSTGAPQTCTLTLTATDGQGQVQSASLTVVVQSGPAGSCTLAVSPLLLDLPSGGGTHVVNVTTQDGCPWTATSPHAWIRVASGAAGTGSAAVSLQIDPTAAAGMREGTITIAGASVQVTQAGLGYTYYLAEGATIGGFFDTRIALLNPDLTQPAKATVEFQLKDSAAVLTHELWVGAHQRATIDVKNLGALNPALSSLASAEFSTVVRSKLPLVVDRTMTWDGRAYGGHSETAVDAPASTWYFAEGATIGNFELYYLIQNPNAVPLDNEIEVTYLLPPPAAPIVRTYSMGPNTRRNIAVHAEAGLENAEVSAIIRTPSTKPVIAERAMYLTTADLFYGAGHESAGIRTPRIQWFFAEGATGDFFDLFILIGNPNDAPARVTATFLFDDGTTCSKAVGNTSQAGAVVVGAKSRHNVWVDLESMPGCPRSLAQAAVSTTISSDLPIVAERTMWWPGPTAATWAEAHNTPGATGTGTVWATADGEQGGSRNVETYVLVANTSPFDGSARVTLYFEDGTSVEKTVELLANSRTTVPVGAGRDPARQPLGKAERAGFGFGPIAVDRRFGVVVESLPVPGQAGPAALVVERASYWNAPGAPLWAAGTNALATRLR